MSAQRRCAGTNVAGRPCGAPPQTNSSYCWMHDPANEEAVREGRRLGGIRRKREVAVHGAYDIEHIVSVGGVERVIEIAILDVLGIESSLSRARTLLYGAMVSMKAIETRDFGDRLRALERAVLQRDDEGGVRGKLVDAGGQM